MQEPNIKKNRFSFLWLLPILALGVGLYLAYSRYNHLGPSITIELENAAGLEVNRTKIRYRSLDIGTVTDISLTDDFKKVIIHAQMTHNALPLLNKDTQFWVVNPQISASGISGLETLISGSFIALSPGAKAETERHFVGLKKPPLIPTSEPGIHIRLVTDSTKGLYAGSPVYYRGMRVGQIDQIEFNENYDRIYVEAFINAPYNTLINSNSKFWNIGGFDLKFSANGAEFSMQSLETLALGGITFSTPISLSNEENTFNKNTVFTLYKSEQDIYQASIYRKEYYVVYFEDSIRGLNTGAPVEFNGIEIGEVIDIRLLYDEEAGKAVIPVLVELEPEHITRVKTSDKDEADLFKTLIAGGLQASMETGSIITGEKFIRLSMYPDDTQLIVTDQYSSYPVLPSRNTGLTQITDDIGEIVERVKNLPFESLFSKAESAMDSLDKTVSTQEVQQIGKTITITLKQLESTLASIQTTSKSANTLLKDLNSQIVDISKQLEQTIAGISPDSNLYYTLNETLQALEKSAKSLDRVMLQIDAKPNSLIFGE